MGECLCKKIEHRVLVSVIIPVYNERRFLENCVGSVLNQSFSSFEIILVDDGSNNGASEDCDMLAKTDSRIKVIHKENEGLSAARITGLNNSNGEWIMFMDHDDIVSPYILESFFLFISEDVDIIAGGRIDSYIPDKIKWVKNKNVEIITDTGRNICEMIRADGQENIITPMWGKIYRSLFLKSLDVERYKELCPTIFFEDILMTPIIYSQARRITILKEKMYVHREIKTSISRSGKLSAFYYEQIDSGDILINYAKANNLPKLFRYSLGDYFRIVIRIYCLMDNYLDDEKRVFFRKKITQKLVKYRKDYFKYAIADYKYKFCSIIFFCSPYVMKKIYRSWIV